MKKIPLCYFCEKEAGEREENPTGYIRCQGCGISLCDECTEYGYDNLPYCGECFFEQKEICEEECKGDMKKHHCEYCDYCN